MFGLTQIWHFPWQGTGRGFHVSFDLLHGSYIATQWDFIYHLVKCTYPSTVPRHPDECLANSDFGDKISKFVSRCSQGLKVFMKNITKSWKYPFESIKSLQCYELTSTCSGCSHFLLMLGSSLLYTWSVHCKCALMQKQQQIFNYLHFQDTIYLNTQSPIIT